MGRLHFLMRLEKTLKPPLKILDMSRKEGWHFPLLLTGFWFVVGNGMPPGVEGASGPKKANFKSAPRSLNKSLAPSYVLG